MTMQEGQQVQQGGVTYQVATLTPQLADQLIKDDSPQILQDSLWQFLNMDISAANLTYVDILNILDFVDIAFCNFLCGIQEGDWDKFKVQEIVWEKNEKGKPV